MTTQEVFSSWRRVIWQTIQSPAASAAYRRGGGYFAMWESWSVGFVLSHLAKREKEWSAMNGRKSKGFIQNMKFVDLELTSEGKEAFKKWGFGDEDVIAYLEAQGEAGYKIGARYDRSNGTWIASLTCSEEKHKNYGWCLSARGRSWLHAFSVLAYKDVVLLEGNWAAVLEPEDNDAGWG